MYRPKRHVAPTQLVGRGIYEEIFKHFEHNKFVSFDQNPQKAESFNFNLKR